MSSLRSRGVPLLEKTIIRIFDVPVVRVKVSEIRLGAPEWVPEVIKYLDTGDLPNEKWEARKVKSRVACFALIDGILYRRDFLAPLLRFILLDEAHYILTTCLQGVCENHSIGHTPSRSMHTS